MCYRKVVDNFIILLVLKFDSHKPDRLGVVFFTSLAPRFRKLNCLIQFNIESILGDYKSYAVLLSSFPKSLGSLFLVI
jgi:hypothetical protein